MSKTTSLWTSVGRKARRIKLWFADRNGRSCLVNRFFLATLIVVNIGSWPSGADAWVRPYRPEYAFGWGYLPPLGFGFDWLYPDIVGGEDAAHYDAVPKSRMTAFCAQRYKTYDPTTQTYLGYDGRRHPCP
jgi:hypothetical protein